MEYAGRGLKFEKKRRENGDMRRESINHHYTTRRILSVLLRQVKLGFSIALQYRK
jgi:hypothetical protein